MPYVLERADKLWAERDPRRDLRLDAAAPAEQLRPRPHLRFCIFDDEVGLQNRDVIGMDQITFEVDYPHADSTFPHSKETSR